MPFFEVPEYPPGTRLNSCLTCTTERKTAVPWRDGGERLIDLGVSVDSSLDEFGQPAIIEAHAIICETCVRELASMVDLVEQGQGPYHVIAMRNKALEAEVAHLTAIVHSLRGAKDFLAGVRRG